MAPSSRLVRETMEHAETESPSESRRSGSEVVSVLKRDAFGRIELVRRDGVLLVRRVPCGGSIPGTALLARILARRERRALERLAGIEGVPALVAVEGRDLLRTYIPGRRLDRGGRPPDDYFERLEALVRRIHERGVAHNDLAKEANLLLGEDGAPAVVDFQVAAIAGEGGWRRAEGRFFRLLRREDLRHLAKQKALRRPELLTEEDRHRLARRSLAARGWAAIGKPVYRFVTRRLLSTSDSEGEGSSRSRTA